jgi:hypothetical protein
MDSTDSYDLKNETLKARYNNTLRFMKESLPPGKTILDIGIENPFSKIMQQEGYIVSNTTGEDLDDHPEIVTAHQTDAATAFEIFEHLLNPLGVLQQIKANHLFASVPLTLWFAKAYRHKTNEWDRHFHEFEDWQFDWLLEKAGWKIVRREKWTSPTGLLGVRPILRRFTPRYYIVEAKRQ